MNLSIEQLIAICKDLSSAIDVVQVVFKHLPPDEVGDALAYRKNYLRDIKLLLEE
jgi:hypothetical protein